MMKKILHMIVAFILVASASTIYFNLPPDEIREQAFTVNHGESVRMIAANLETQNHIRSRHFFIYASYLLKRHYIRAGKYDLPSNMTAIEILKKLSRGDVVAQKVLIPEGFNVFQIADRLEANNICSSAAFIGRATDGKFLRSIQIESSSAEGYLFPDTYVFAEGSDPADIIAIMRRHMERTIGEIPLRGGKSVHEILTLASLIEKEAKLPGERELISSVFHNRLSRNMKLDCDPTVRYATKKFAGPITVRDLNVDSPYNTYKINGLPPTPICSPGRESIIAAVNPDTTDYLYFVAKNDGAHHFSTSLREHNKAVQQYQR